MLKLVMVLLLVVAVSGSAQSAAPQKRPASAVPKYDLNIQLNPDAHRLAATGTIQLPPASSAHESFELALSDRMHDFKVDSLEASGVAGLPELTRKEESNESVTWVVRPPKPVPVGQPVLIRFSYTGGEKDAFVFHLGPTSSFASGPSIAWYPAIGYADRRGIGTMRFSVPQGYTVIASGASRGTPEQAAHGVFEFAVDLPAQLSFAAGTYTVIRRNGVVPVSAYVLHSRPNIQEYLDGCARILAVLTEEFGPYPYGQFAIAEVPPDIAQNAGFGGASNPGFMLSSTTGLDSEFNLARISHQK